VTERLARTPLHASALCGREQHLEQNELTPLRCLRPVAGLLLRHLALRSSLPMTCLFPMNGKIDKATALVLNVCLQAINVKTPAQAFCMMAGDSATALDIAEDRTMTPTRWADRILLPVRERDNATGTARV
jgi:hypothetical protein